MAMYPSVGNSGNPPPPPPPSYGYAPPPPPSGSSDPPPPSYADAVSSFGLPPPPPPAFGGPVMSNLPPPPPPPMGQSYFPPPPPPSSDGGVSSLPPPPPPSGGVVPSLTQPPSGAVSSVAPPAQLYPSFANPNPIPQPSPPPQPMANSAGSFTNTNLEGRKLMYIGVRNVVICRDATQTGKEGSIEVWRHEMGAIESGHECSTSVVFCNGRVVARYLKTLIALDPITGALLWSTTIPEYGTYDLCVMVVSQFVVYLGVKNIVMAISAVDGMVIWRYIFPTDAQCLLPTVLCCGSSLFLVGGKEMACLDITTGNERWRKPFKNGFPAHGPTAAWDEKNRVLLGACGYVYPVDLRNGTEGTKINLKGTGYNCVNLAFDKYRDVFYIHTSSMLYALSGGDSNTLVWKHPVQHTSNGSLAIEIETGRIYAIGDSTIMCVDLNGNLLFRKTFDEPRLSRKFYSVVLDLFGSGRLFIGSGGYYIVVDSEGNKIESDNLEGMRFGSTVICTPTASLDPNSSGEVYQRLESSG